MLSYVKALPERLLDFYNYLLSYPEKKPASVDDAFYWAKVKFGLKASQPAYSGRCFWAIVSTQLDEALRNNYWKTPGICG